MVKNDEQLVGLIPAAGEGTRLSLPFPKELFPVIHGEGYKVISQFVMENLVIAGAKHIIVVINQTKHQLLGHFGNGHKIGCEISYVVQENKDTLSESTSPGLAFALDSAYHLTKGKTVLFGMADTLMKPENVFKTALDSSEPEDDIILGLFPTSRPEKFGMCDIETDGLVTKVIDKPNETDLKYMWGFIIWREKFTELLHEQIQHSAVTDFALILNLAIESGMKVRGIPFKSGKFFDLGTFEEIPDLYTFDK